MDPVTGALIAALAKPAIKALFTGKAPMGTLGHR